MRTTACLLVCVMAAFATGCESIPGVSSLFSDEDPDLLLVPAAGFCKEGPTVVVALRNRGPTNAGESSTRIVFSPGGERRLVTPGVESGRIVTLPPVAIPPECFSPDCVVQVTVDVDDDVEESNEANNSEQTTCSASLASGS